MSDDAPIVYGTLSHARPAVYPAFNNAGAPDQIAGSTPDGPRSIPVPMGVATTPGGDGNFSTEGAPDQRPGGAGEAGRMPAGFTGAPDDVGDSYFADALASVRAMLSQRADAVAERPDPDLAHFRGKVNSIIDTHDDAWDARAKSRRQDPARNRYKPEALAEMDAQFAREREAAEAALEDKLSRELATLARRNAERAERASGFTVTREHDAAAMQAAARLASTVPAAGRAVLGDILQDAAEDPAFAHSVEPLLKSLWLEHPKWQRNPELFETNGALRALARPPALDGSAYDATQVELEHYFDARRDPVAGRFIRGMVASGTGRMGDAPMFFPDAPTEPPARPSQDGVARWKPIGGKVPRGKKPVEE